MITVLESERGKIAREIHDEAGQLLISAAFRLDQAVAALPRAFVARDLLEQARQMLDECAEALHRLAFNLRPRMLDDLGLLPALRSYLNRYADLSDVETQVDLAQPDCSLSPATELTIFRIVQEAIANIRKHSQATVVRVRLGFTDAYVELEVSDNGIGFEPGEANRVGETRPRLGLEGMRERVMALGGELRVESKRLAGTSVRAKLPIQDARDNSRDQYTI